MRKQNNISAYTRQIFGLALMSILFFACQENEIIKSTDVKEGIPVKVSFNISAPEMKKIVTRGLRDEEEYQINDLYLLIFDARGNIKEGTRFYSTDELLDNNKNQYSSSTGILKDIETTSGVSYIFAVANTNSNQLSGDGNIKRKLDKVTTLDEFRKVTATLNSKTDAAQVDRTQAALVMCGAFVPNASSETSANEGECIIPDKNGALNGKILLERLDSHITFKISWGGKDSKVTSFELTSWKVYNVPVKSYLLANEQDAVTNDKEHYSTTIAEQKVTTDENDKSSSFDFYMLENRKNERMYEGHYLQSYAEREAEVKDNNLNTGVYKYIEPYATYVEIKANIELISSNQDLATGKKVANVTYTIHLGGGSTDFGNFKSERNKKYTYNVEINDTEDIRVEVQEDNERRPGVEGDVVDAKTKVYTLDAHYNCFIISFTKTEAQELSFMVKTPFGTVDSKSNNSQRANGDYKWIRFARSEDANTLAVYPEYGKGLIDLFGLSADIAEQSQNESDDNEIYYYTVFVDEYYYDTPPAGANWEQPYWKYFVNKENRDVILLFTPQYSQDKESSYADAQYMITQRSIQTYYSSTNFNDEQTALGMEHVNETGAPANHTPTNMNYNVSNGFYNAYQYITKSNTAWNAHAKMTEPNVDGYTFTLSRKYGWSACLSRNRDENHNNVIDPEELKWYLPARDQLMGMFLGAESLTTPLFDADSYPVGSITTGNAKYQYLLSDNRKLWADEGASIGATNAPGSGGYPQQLRCVRNLNLDMNAGNATEEERKVSNAFKYNEATHVFTMAQLDEKNIRGKLDSGELGLHDNFSSTNKPYNSFQMAANFHTAAQGYGRWAEFVNIDNLHRSRCNSYYEKTDQSDKGKWRTPNQREFMIMYTQSKDFVYNPSSGYRAYSRTEWKYNSKRYFGYNSGILFLDNGQSFYVSLRCVRDVDIDANGNIIETDSNGTIIENN